MSLQDVAFGGADRGRRDALRSAVRLALSLLGLLALRRRTKSNLLPGAGLLALVLWTIRAPTPRIRPPGSPHHDPIIGAMRHFSKMRRSFVLFWYEYAKKTNFKSFDVTLPGNKRMIVAMDEDDRQYVLRDNWKNYCKNTKAEGFDILFEEASCVIRPYTRVLACSLCLVETESCS